MQFRAGNLKNCLDARQKATNDFDVLDWVAHCHIKFVNNVPPVQTKFPHAIKFNDKESVIIDKEIEKLLNKGVLIPSQHEIGEFISPIFLRLKKNGIDYRMILNLKELNSFVEYEHFKMESLRSVIGMMTPNCYMASIDIKDAYYTVPIALEHQKYLKFAWRDKLYQYTCLPNGLSSAPRIFTKIMKPVFQVLRQQGHMSSSYIDHCYLQGDTYNECAINVDVSTARLRHSGFFPHEEKSQFTPTQQMTYLGFDLDSVHMTVKLTKQRASTIRIKCASLIHEKQITILALAQGIGHLVSSFPGVEFGPLYYRNLESDKTVLFANNHGNYAAKIALSANSISELRWWVNNVEMAVKPISHGEPHAFIKTDASMHGWGAVRDGTKTGGRWTMAESHYHINYLELLAILFILKALCHNCADKHIRVECDNTTAVCYINNMGGTKSNNCNAITKQIWEYCIEHRIWLSAAHLPGCKNIDADFASWQFNDRTEWMLDSRIFEQVTSKFGKPSIDLFASRLNKQC